MIKYKKIRGEKRRIRKIKQWIDDHLDLDIAYLKRYQCEYVKFWVDPWDRLSLTNSQYPQPQGIYKELFFNGLLQIYMSWKEQLDFLDQPYYLKIWLFENDLKRSQVVCAIGEKIEYYQNLFEKPLDETSLSIVEWQEVSDMMKKVNWEKKIEITLYEKDWLGRPDDYKTQKNYEDTRKWFNNNIIEKYREVKRIDGDEYYIVETDNVWIGYIL
ncbi:hypothetical protein IC784_01515 [Acinetobacter seifertii]|uniref:DUF3841 domain-containing protein n=1 Tax=Acinetobacter seifertii TaxID=1530123 RepID=A0A7H2TB90_9GAMM|nr:hypothetical protein IC795_01370 [Acinetobacter seifertii]QNX49123.1 hypothetical protein IC784_01515 [Acinetobacter seifertii]QNY17572.1 hypothetical protein IC765_01585 [Acinetobacter seifertii]